MNLVTRTEIIGGAGDEILELCNSYRQVSGGWVCNVCAAHVLENRDAKKHLEWHAALDG